MLPKKIRPTCCATSLNFRTPLANGVDLTAVDHASKTIWAPEVKASTVGSFPNPESLNLLIRTSTWIEEAAEFGRIAGKPVSAAEAAYTKELQFLLEQGYQIKPLVVNVSIPVAGGSGNATAVIIPLKK